MSVPVPLRGDFEAGQLRGLAKKTKDGPHPPAWWRTGTGRYHQLHRPVGFQSARVWVIRAAFGRGRRSVHCRFAPKPDVNATR